MNPFTKIKNRLTKIKKDKDFGEIFSGSILVMVTKTIATLIGLVTSIVVARYYGAEMVGILALVNSFFAITTVFTLMGTNTSILRLIPEYTVKFSKYAAKLLYYKSLGFVTTLTVVLGIILFFGADLIADKFFKRPDLSFIFMIASGVLFFRTIQQFSLQGIRALKHIKSFALFNSLRPVLFLILLVLFTTFSYNVFMPVYLQFVAIVIVSISSSIYIRYIFNKTPKDDNQKIIISNKEIFSVSWPMFLTASMMVIMGNLAILMIGFFNDEKEVGYYTIAFKIATLTVFILKSINTVVAPKFAELFHDGKMDELFSIARKSTKLIFWSVMPLLLVFVLFGKFIIVKLYGPEFAVCFIPLLILVAGMFVSAMSGSVGYFMNMCGYEKQFKNIMLFALALNVIINILLTPAYGAVGAAIATAVTQVFWNISATIYIYRKYHKSFIYIPIFVK